jgi:predicted GNAT family N-acyltransferase
MSAEQAAAIRLAMLDWEQAREAAAPIREQVFVAEQGVPRKLEWDDLDSASRHCVAWSPQGVPVATGRLLPDGHIGRMAVLAAWRGRGIGAEVLAALLEEARRRGLAAAVLHAQTHAAGFYRRFGFREEGPEYQEAGIAHVTMRRPLDPAGLA